MRTKTIYYVAFLLLMASVFSLLSCSKLFGPSDADVIKAINESGALKDLAMQSPIVVLKKDGNKDGSWNVIVKVKFTYDIGNGQVSAAVEKTPVFNLRKVKDSAGKDTWKAVSNP